VTSFVAGRVSSRGKLGSTESLPTSKNDQFFRQLPESRIRLLFVRIFSNAIHPRQHADDIAVENRCGLIEGDAANRAGGVTANPRQRENIFKLFRELAN
jgi:hypothetical protein